METQAHPVRSDQTALGALVHRWLFEDNPLYLLSAALVLAGLTLMSGEVARGGSAAAILGVSALAEIYSLALIGGAALLVRMGRRRPAAMLGLLVVVYQGDLTMHVETCAYLGVTGRIAAAAWALLFAVKLHALARALELRLSFAAFLVPTIGAAGLATLPQLLRDTDTATKGAMVALWLFALGAGALWSARSVESAVPWHARGRRCVHATWGIWGALALGHACYWALSWGVPLGLAAPAIPLLALRWARRERTVWATVGVTVIVTFLAAPQLLWMVTLMSAVTLVLTATRAKVGGRERTVRARPAPPYRSVESSSPREVEVAFHPDPTAPARLLVGGLVAAYLAASTAGWSGRGLPEHPVFVDVLLLVACVAIARHTRRPLLAWPVAPLLLFAGVRLGVIPLPESAFGWGVASTGAGFAALVGALAASWWGGLEPRGRP